MNINEEKALLLNGIKDIKAMLLAPKASSADLLDMLDRLENLRTCLEILLRKEMAT